VSKDVIIACDFSSYEKTKDFISDFRGIHPYVKVGMELYYSTGPDIIRYLKDEGCKIFLDLKLHDIPNTVRKSMKALARLGVDMVNVHASGTTDMMKAAVEGIHEGQIGETQPLVIGVTVLTSIDQSKLKNEWMTTASVEEMVSHLAENAKSSGLDGVVCSPLEVSRVKQICGPNFLTVTPGIRFGSDSKDDQKRVTTPEMAGQLGSDFIVVGRSITGSAQPVQAYLQCKEDFEKGYQTK